MQIYIYIYIYIFVAIESWPEWDLNPRPLNSVQTLKPIELLGQEFNLHSEPTLYSYFNFIICSVPHFIPAIAFVSCRVCFNGNFVEVITQVQRNELIHMVFTTEGLSEVAIESIYPKHTEHRKNKRNLSQRKLN